MCKMATVHKLCLLRERGGQGAINRGGYCTAAFRVEKVFDVCSQQ